MTKTQILAEIAAKPFVSKVMGVQLVSTLIDGTTKIYHAEVLEVTDSIYAVGRTIAFYCVDEGLPTEACYYKDKEALPLIQPFMDKVKPLLKQYNGSIKEQGETWCLAETNTLINTNGVYSIQKDNYFVVDGEPLNITKIG